MFHCKYFAFTLAEVLVTLGIIGVVSAMTVPSLMQNYQRQSYVAQLHKFYNELSQASVRYMTDKNALSLKEAGLTSTAALDDFFKTNFKIINDCGNTSTPCFAPNSEYRKINGNSCGTYKSRYITLVSGVSLGYTYDSGEKIVSIDVDINGQKGPNIAGRDAFVITLYSNGLIDDAANEAPLTKEQRDTLYTENCAGANSSWIGCFGKILNDNWQMTY